MVEISISNKGSYCYDLHHQTKDAEVWGSWFPYQGTQTLGFLGYRFRCPVSSLLKARTVRARLPRPRLSSSVQVPGTESQGRPIRDPRPGLKVGSLNDSSLRLP